LGLAIVSMGLSAYTLARKKEKNNSEQSHWCADCSHAMSFSTTILFSDNNQSEY
jgi:hypothetical protein